MASAARYIRDLQARGRYHFTTDEAVQALGGSVAATCAALRRLKEKGLVADPYRSFHVIVPPEYVGLRCLPADQFVPDLMQHLREPYYVALLMTRAQFEANLNGKRTDPSFRADVEPLLRSGVAWDFDLAMDAVLERLVASLPGDAWRGV